MERHVRFVISGMCTITPPATVQTADELIVLLMECPSRRRSRNDWAQVIVRHLPLICVNASAVHEKNSRRVTHHNNGYNYVAWTLDKEHIECIADRGKGIIFDSSVTAHIASIDEICPSLRGRRQFRDPKPADLTSVGGRFVIRTGLVSARGRLRTATFSPVCDGGRALTKDICDMVAVDVSLDIDDADGLLLHCTSLDTSPAGEDIRLKWFPDELEPNVMSIYILSTPEEDLNTIPPLPYYSVTDAPTTRMTVAGLAEEVDFELYYDLSVDPSVFKLPIPHYSNNISLVNGDPPQYGGPLPGTDRCPPLQNTLSA